MRTLSQVLAEMDRAGIFWEAKEISVRTERFDGETALHIFAKWGDAEAIRVLVANGAVIDKKGEDDNTPLHYAAMLGHVEATRALVELGAVNAKDMYGNYPAGLAQDHPDVLAYLKSVGYA